MPLNPDKFLDLARSIAIEAGDLLLAERAALSARPEVVETKSSPTDVVTALDRAAEDLIQARIAENRPDDAILGEEGGDTPGAGDARWVVDPIDGTVNFLYGLPAWSVSIGVEVDGAIVAGVVNVPPMGEVFTAVRGGGAFLNDRPISCTTGVPLDRRAGGDRFRVRRGAPGRAGAGAGRGAAAGAGHPPGRVVRGGPVLGGGRAGGRLLRARDQLLGPRRRRADRRGGRRAGRGGCAGRRTTSNWAWPPRRSCSSSCTTCCSAWIPKRTSPRHGNPGGLWAAGFGVLGCFSAWVSQR